jgi:cell division GTPase FtsZ
MIDFKDVTFIIPVRFDSEDRKRNFRITIAFLEKHFDTNIIVWNQTRLQTKNLLNQYQKN